MCRTHDHYSLAFFQVFLYSPPILFPSYSSFCFHLQADFVNSIDRMKETPIIVFKTIHIYRMKKKRNCRQAIIDIFRTNDQKEWQQQQK